MNFTSTQSKNKEELISKDKLEKIGFNRIIQHGEQTDSKLRTEKFLSKKEMLLLVSDMEGTAPQMNKHQS